MLLHYRQMKRAALKGRVPFAPSSYVQFVQPVLGVPQLMHSEFVANELLMHTHCPLISSLYK